MTDFIVAPGSVLLKQSGFAGFDEFWSLPFEAVDLPGIRHGGWSSVFGLEIVSAAFYLKRRSIHLIRSLPPPLVRCAERISYDGVRLLLMTYIGNDCLLASWSRRLTPRCQIKEARG